MQGQNIPPTSYLLPPARCAAPCRAKRCSAPSDASCPPERSILAPLLYASVPSGRAVHCPLSIIHSPFPILPSHTAKLQHGGGEIKNLAPTAPRGPRFPSCLPLQRAHCQPLSGKWAFVLCPCPSRPSPSPCPVLY